MSTTQELALPTAHLSAIAQQCTSEARDASRIRVLAFLHRVQASEAADEAQGMARRRRDPRFIPLFTDPVFLELESCRNSLFQQVQALTEKWRNHLGDDLSNAERSEFECIKRSLANAQSIWNDGVAGLIRKHGLMDALSTSLPEEDLLPCEGTSCPGTSAAAQIRPTHKDVAVAAATSPTVRAPLPIKVAASNQHHRAKRSTRCVPKCAPRPGLESVPCTLRQAAKWFCLSREMFVKFVNEGLLRAVHLTAYRWKIDIGDIPEENKGARTRATPKAKRKLLPTLLEKARVGDHPRTLEVIGAPSCA